MNTSFSEKCGIQTSAKNTRSTVGLDNICEFFFDVKELNSTYIKRMNRLHSQTDGS